MMTDDMVLLQDFAEHESQDAFAELVSRHINLVYSVALRQTGDASLAEETTQAVFVVLARKAKSLGPNTIVSGWLCRTARFASADALKAQRRRQIREQEAYMQSTLNEPSDDTSDPWLQIGPLLDTALAHLGEKDHNAIVLRYLENKSPAEVGVALGTSEEAAKMRVSRALDKMRKFFSKRGITLTTAIIAGTISANSVQAAPAELAAVVAAAKGTATTTSTLALAKGTINIMTWMKLKFAMGLATALLLVGGATTVVLSNNNDSRGIRPATAEERAFIEKIVRATKDKDYAAFQENGDKGFHKISKGEFLAVCVQMEEQFQKSDYAIDYLGDLREKGSQVTLWRISFKDGSDDSLGRMWVKKGKVTSFLMQ